MNTEYDNKDGDQCLVKVGEDLQIKLPKELNVNMSREKLVDGTQINVLVSKS